MADYVGNNTIFEWLFVSNMKNCNSRDRDFTRSPQLALIIILSLVIISNFFSTLVKRFIQPRMVSEAIIGCVLVYAILRPMSTNGDLQLRLIYVMVRGGMTAYMFALGLEMDFKSLFLLSREAKIAYAGMIPPILIGFFVSPYLDLWLPDKNLRKGDIYFVFFTRIGLSATLSSTASPLLTRMITDMKIGKSDIGKFAVASGRHCDLASVFILMIAFVITDSENNQGEVLVALIVQSIFISKVGQAFVSFVNDRSPLGKSMNESLLVLSVAFVAVMFIWLTSFGLLLPYSAFITGLFLQREGRVSRMFITKINFVLNSIIYPLLFVYMGLSFDFSVLTTHGLMFWFRFFAILGTVTVAKVAGTLAAAVFLGFHWREAAIIGLFLAIKGYPHIYTVILAGEMNLLNSRNFLVLEMVVISTVLYIPLLGSYIIKRARQRSPVPRMALQWLDQTNELRMMLCLRGIQNLNTAISFMEISRSNVDPGIVVYATDLIELTDTIAATLVHGEGVDVVTVSENSVTEMRKHITDEIQAYVEADGDGITMRRMLAVSAITTMHADICALAEDLMVSLIVLPFHKNMGTDGKFDSGNNGFRYVNKKVMRQAPCSVGVLVDRGLGRVGGSGVQVSVIFIGGKDDREALAYSGRIAKREGVELRVIRFMVEREGEEEGGTVHGKSEEAITDDSFFTEFYDTHVVHGHVSYMEKYLANSGEAFTTLHSLEKQCSLFVVGRGSGVGSILTAGMDDWHHSPELGPIGDILSGPEFSRSASVLVLNQHSHRGHLPGIHDQFSIM